MLVNNNFIFISLPRCASTSFQMSCLEQNFELEYYDENASRFIKKITDSDIIHYHESIVDLQNKFGQQFPVISIRRDPQECYLSMWKHILNVSNFLGNQKLVEVFTNLKIKDILCYETTDILTPKSRSNHILKFLTKINLNYKEINENILSLLNTMIIPASTFHNHNDSIIWFDINKLVDLELWVSDRLKMDFKLKHLNSSDGVNCKINNDDEFKELYHKIYGTLNKPKIKKSII